MMQQCFIPPGKFLRIIRFINRGRQPVRLMRMGNPAQFPQRMLKPLTQALETFAETDGARLPVRVRQHEMVYQMRKRNPANRNPQAVH